MHFINKVTKMKNHLFVSRFEFKLNCRIFIRSRNKIKVHCFLFIYLCPLRKRMFSQLLLILFNSNQEIFPQTIVLQFYASSLKKVYNSKLLFTLFNDDVLSPLYKQNPMNTNANVKWILIVPPLQSNCMCQRILHRYHLQ